MGRIFGLLFLCFFTFCTLQVPAQEAKPKELPTAKVKRRVNENTSKQYVFPKTYKHIYRKNTKKIMYGNACAVGQTRKMGFEYVVRTNGKIASKTKAGAIANNIWVGTLLVITRSPFWKLILNKRLEDCRKASGDWVG